MYCIQLFFKLTIYCHFFFFLQNICTNEEKHYYKGTLNGTIHVAAGGAGASLSLFTTLQTKWSFFRDFDYGFIKLTAFDHSNLLFEYKKSRDGKVYDSFRISRDYRDILACTVDSCPSMTLASWMMRFLCWLHNSYDFFFKGNYYCLTTIKLWISNINIITWMLETGCYICNKPKICQNTGICN